MQHLHQSFILAVFSVLNVLLWTLCSDALPKRELYAYGLGLLAALTVPQWIPHDPQVTLMPSQKFRNQFRMLSSCEVLFLIVIPWTLILIETFAGDKEQTQQSTNSARWLFAPHLFIFQVQIALESLLFHKGPWMIFGYTCLANTYRFLALVTGLVRAHAIRLNGGVDSADWSILHVLLAISVLLWVASNAFIIFTWYPQLPGVASKQHER